MNETYRPHPLDARLAAALPAGALFAVGGRVRDELRDPSGAPPHDLDYVVAGVPLERVGAALAPLGRVDLVGASFAVIKLTVEGVTVDVALPRREHSTGSGHRDFAIESGPEIPLEDDLSRRDFRMNMIARALPAGTLVDPFDGAADIAARRISILTPRTFQEDPLRLLRAAQFAARFGFTADPATVAAMREAAPLVASVSAERVADELTKLLTLAPKPSAGFELLRETGVLAHIWPELLEGVGVEQNEWHAYDVWHHTMAAVDAVPPGDLIVRAAGLLHDVGKPRTKDGPHFYRHEHVGADQARGMLQRFRFSNETVTGVEHLVRQHMYSQDSGLSDAAVRRFVRRIGLDLLARQFALRRADIVASGLPKRDDSNERFEMRVRDEIAREPAFSIADLSIGGADVIAVMVERGLAEPGFAGDARVGAALHWLFEQVTDAPERNERTSLLHLLERHFGSL